MSKKFAGLVALVFAVGAAIQVYVFLREKDKPREFFGVAPKPASGFTTMDDWTINIYSPDDRTKVKAELRAWKFQDGGNTCYVFLQRNNETWIPTSACK